LLAFTEFLDVVFEQKKCYDEMMTGETIDLNILASRLKLPFAVAKKAIEERAAQAARETTGHATAAPRLKWEQDRLPDENPAAFAWRAYQAEAQAGTLHRGIIYSEDRELHRRLNSWLRSHAMPEGIDIPTKPEWITRQADAGRAKPAPVASRPRTEEQRLYDALASRRYRARHGSPDV
jgi:hypothetical protein